MKYELNDNHPCKPTQYFHTILCRGGLMAAVYNLSTPSSAESFSISSVEEVTNLSVIPFTVHSWVHGFSLIPKYWYHNFCT